jgi:hypothetical protein
MRLLIGTVLVLCVVTASAPGTSPRGTPQKGDGRAKKERPAQPVADNPIPIVIGVGATHEEAENDALKRARDELSRYLASEYGETSWKPSVAFLRESGAARLVGEPEKVSIPGEGENERVKMEVLLTPEVIHQIQELAREQRMGQRQWVAARGLAAILALLLVVFGYLKLEDVTKGYYSMLLRLTALTVLALTGLFLWHLG